MAVIKPLQKTTLAFCRGGIKATIAVNPKSSMHHAHFPFLLATRKKNRILDHALGVIFKLNAVNSNS